MFQYPINKKVYLALGDSLTVGIAAGYGRSFPCLFYKCLKERSKCVNFDYCNLGVIGWSSSDLLNAIRFNNSYRRAISLASVITIDIGGNDILAAKNSLPCLNRAIYMYRLNLNTILAEMKCLNADAVILLMNLYNPYTVNHKLYEIAQKSVGCINYIIQSCCSFRSNVRIADTYNRFKGRELELTLIRYGNVHPNTIGHEEIANSFIEIYIF